MDESKLQGFFSFVGDLAFNDRVAVLHDSDADGVSAAVIVSKAIERIRGKKPDFVFTQFKRMVSIEPQTVTLLRKKKINKLIVLDLAVDQRPKKVKEIEKFARVMVIDHHKVYHNLSSKKTVFLKAGLLSKVEPSKYATSKLSFDLFSKIVDLSDVAWVACVGLVGDFSVQAWKSFVDKTLNDSDLSLSQIKSCTELISAVEIIHVEDISDLFEVYFASAMPQDLLKSKYSSYMEKVEKELSRILKEFNQKSEVFQDIGLVFFEFKSRYSIKSYLINHLSTRMLPNKTIVVVEDLGNGILTLSARRQDFKVRVNDLLENAVKNLNGGIAGGHVPAAGGKIRKQDFPKFKQNIIRILSAKKKKK